ncbi:MAG: UDP-N-acetylmuramoyl-tripeptide--D-alanyl-D-alanine ligase [Candidatus Kapaibacterium sp.]|nr:MAG: UDP-N-acetylmuramoyl-tripeptide--D-alanyl-D-alanine ligase [Candidatus Kapabacteria bacterium]
MPLFTREELVAVLQPVACDNLDALDVVEGISTDSRTLRAGNLFVALRGERFDGHAFVADAIERGARAFVLDASYRGHCAIGDTPTFWVVDTLTAYGDLARAYRRRFDVPVVAVAGAVGKTTTKDIAAHLLAARYSVHRTPGNWNNRVGVPHVLLGIEPDHTAVVVEIGTNRPGEIAELCRITEPTHGVITAIAEEHLEFLGSLDGVEQEETALFRWLADHGGHACVNLDDSRLARYANKMPHVLTFGRDEAAQLRANFVFEHGTLFPILELAFEGRKVQAKLSHPGYGAAFCAIAASAVAVSLGVELEAIAHELGTYRPTASHGYARMQVEEGQGGVTILNDCYNANPASMRAALDTLSAYPTAQQRIAVLGDMRELGAASDAEHRAILRYAAERAEVLIGFGEAMEHAIRSLDGSLHCTVAIARSHREAAAIVRLLARPGDVVLVKGSRSMMLEHVIAELRGQRQEP